MPRGFFKAVTRLVAALRDAHFWRVISPLLIPVGLLPWLWVCASHYGEAPLFRDVGMFQYAGWALRMGERLYEDVTTPDGPLIYLIHAALQFVTGTSESAFRTADIIVHALGAGVMGWLLAPAAKSHETTRRLLWATVSISVWLSYLFSFDFSGSVQREAFYSLLGHVGLVLAYAAATRPTRRARWMLVTAGVLCGVQLFGKHTGLVYLALAAMATALDAEQGVGPPRRERLVAFGAGGLGAGLAMLLLIVTFGSLRGFGFWYFTYPFEVYRFLATGTIAAGLEADFMQRYARAAGIALVAGGTLTALRVLPPRALVFVVAPAVHYAAGFAQKKFWSYQFHPVMAAWALLLVFGLTEVWRRAPARERWKPSQVGAVLLLQVGVFMWCHDDLLTSSWMKPAKQASSRAIAGSRKAARAVRERTRPGDRVLYYGDHGSTPFLAQRLNAIGQHVVWLINYSDILEMKPPPAGRGPTEEQRHRIRAIEARLQQTACSRLLAAPPAALMITDRAVHGGRDGMADVVRICPPIEAVIQRDYRLLDRYHSVRVFLRNDR